MMMKVAVVAVPAAVLAGGGVAVGIMLGLVLALLALRMTRKSEKPPATLEEPASPKDGTTVAPVAGVIVVAPVADGDRPSPAVTRLIDVRDHVFGNAAPSAELNAWLYARLGNALGDLGVATLEAAGAVDWTFQEVVGTRATTDKALDQTVAATVRPGYRFGETVLRPQQVIAYVAGPG